MPASLAEHSRIVVVGTSCCGKTTFCRQLAGRLALQHIELDALHWGPNWTPRPDFGSCVQEAITAERWVVDGNYTKVREFTWGRATAMVWLNFSFPLVFWRSLRRTCGRIANREEIFSGNRETVLHSFFHWDGIPWWVLRTFHSRRHELRSLLQQPEFFHLRLFELRNPLEADALLAGIGQRVEQKDAEIAKKR